MILLSLPPTPPKIPATGWCSIPRCTRGTCHSSSPSQISPGCDAVEGGEYLPGEAQQLQLQGNGKQERWWVQALLSNLSPQPSPVHTSDLHTRV